MISELRVIVEEVDEAVGMVREALLLYVGAAVAAPLLLWQGLRREQR